MKLGREARSPVIRYTGHLAPWQGFSQLNQEIQKHFATYHFCSEHAHLLRCFAGSSGKASGQVGLDEARRAAGACDLWEPEHSKAFSNLGEHKNLVLAQTSFPVLFHFLFNSERSQTHFCVGSNLFPSSIV